MKQNEFKTVLLENLRLSLKAASQISECLDAPASKRSEMLEYCFDTAQKFKDAAANIKAASIEYQKSVDKNKMQKERAADIMKLRC